MINKCLLWCITFERFETLPFCLSWQVLWAPFEVLCAFSLFCSLILQNHQDICREKEVTANFALKFYSARQTQDNTVAWQVLRAPFKVLCTFSLFLLTDCAKSSRNMRLEGDSKFCIEIFLCHPNPRQYSHFTWQVLRAPFKCFARLHCFCSLIVQNHQDIMQGGGHSKFCIEILLCHPNPRQYSHMTSSSSSL